MSWSKRRYTRRVTVCFSADEFRALRAWMDRKRLCRDEYSAVIRKFVRSGIEADWMSDAASRGRQTHAGERPTVVDDGAAARQTQDQGPPAPEGRGAAPR